MLNPQKCRYWCHSMLFFFIPVKIEILFWVTLMAVSAAVQSTQKSYIEMYFSSAFAPPPLPNFSLSLVCVQRFLILAFSFSFPLSSLGCFSSCSPTLTWQHFVRSIRHYLLSKTSSLSIQLLALTLFLRVSPKWYFSVTLQWQPNSVDCVHFFPLNILYLYQLFRWVCASAIDFLLLVCLQLKTFSCYRHIR